VGAHPASHARGALHVRHGGLADVDAHFAIGISSPGLRAAPRLQERFESASAQAARQQRFLRYLVDETLGGNAERLKGYTIGVEVFERDRDCYPMLGAIVRVEATRLRAKLREYYDGEGGRDAARLEVPKGGYDVRHRVPARTGGPGPPGRTTEGRSRQRQGDAERGAGVTQGRGIGRP